MRKSHTEVFAFRLQNELKNATILFHQDNAWISFQSLSEISCLPEEKLIEVLNKFLKTDEIMDEYVFLYWLPPKKDLYGMEEPPEYIEFFSLEVATWLFHEAKITSKPLEEYTKWAFNKLNDERPNPSRSAVIYVLTITVCAKLSKMMSFEAASIILTAATVIIFLVMESSTLFFLSMIIFFLTILIVGHSTTVLLFPLAVTIFIAVGSYKSRGETQFTHKKTSFSRGYESFRNSVLNLK